LTDNLKINHIISDLARQNCQIFMTMYYIYFMVWEAFWVDFSEDAYV